MPLPYHGTRYHVHILLYGLCWRMGASNELRLGDSRNAIIANLRLLPYVNPDHPTSVKSREGKHSTQVLQHCVYVVKLPADFQIPRSSNDLRQVTTSGLGFGFAALMLERARKPPRPQSPAPRDGFPDLRSQLRLQTSVKRS